MSSRSRVRYTVRHLWTAIGAMALVVGVGAMGMSAEQAPQPASQGDLQGAALEDFKKRLDDYIDLRARLARQLQPLATTASASDLAARQDSLAAALRTARKTARKGDLIPMAVASHLRRVVQADFQLRAPDARKAAFSEVADAGTPIINRLYPARAALPTVPPLLLSKLPMLPDNLQYRFIDRHLVILDGDTQLIIDYVSEVLPPR